MFTRSTVRTFGAAAAVAAGVWLGTSGPTRAQAPAAAGADAHLKGWDAHVTLQKASPYKAMTWKWIGPTNVGGRMTDIAVADANGARRIYAASCCGGVWKSDNLGQSWEPIFDQAASTSIGDVTVSPSNPNIVWIGTGEANIFRSSYAGTGVYKSVDAGKTWQHMGLTDTQTIARIVVHPTNPDIVYLAAGGHEWTENDTRGVFKTTDGGKTWTKILYKGPRTGANDLVMDPSDPNTLYAVMWERIRRKWSDPKNEQGFHESGIYKTTDAGRTWTRLENGLPPGEVLGRIGIDISRSNPKVVYAFVDNYDRGDKAAPGTRNPYGIAIDYYPKGNEVYRSDDKGATWRMTSGQDEAARTMMRGLSSSYGWVFSNMRVDPRDENTIYVLALRASVSHDAGKTFGPYANGGGDNHAMWLDPNDPNVVVNGADSGLMITTDGAKTSARQNIPTTTYFNMAYDMDTPFHVYGSVQDRGSYRVAVDLKGGVTGLTPIAFESAPGGEGSSHAVDPTNPNIVYSSGTYGAITRSDLSIPAAGGRRGAGGRAAAPAPLGPQRSTSIVPKVDPSDEEIRGQWVAPFILSPHDPNTIYFGAQNLFRSRNRGDGWEKLTDDASGRDKAQLGEVPYQVVMAISESPKKAGLVYYAMDDGRVRVSIDAGREWSELTASLPKRRWVSAVQASKYDEGTVYLAQMGRYDDDFGAYLFKSTDYGKTWKSISANLPGGPINMVREDPVKRDVLYACNDYGLYVSTNGGQKWDVLGGNMPSVNVMDFIVHPRDHVLVAGTHGRGVWVIDVSGLEK
jgi:photosystem II stability/assembly factor-like uncharacterized protein